MVSFVGFFWALFLIALRGSVVFGWLGLEDFSLIIILGYSLFRFE